jgi:5-methylcytosine-specific restriction endonuclease McrA
MSRLVCCPRCDEDENLRGERNGDNIVIVCEACGLSWQRDLTPRCDRCGSDDVRPAFKAVVEKSRGTQLSMQSARLIHLCPHCDATLLADYHKTNSPLMPEELPTATE